MYYQHFGLSGPPFQFTPASAALYMSSAHREGLAALQWALQEPSGFAVLIGDVGTGKTTLVYSLLARQHEGVRVAYVTNPKLNFEEMLRLIIGQLGLRLPEPTRFCMLQVLNKLLGSLKPGQRVALIVDEAQDLSDTTLEELRLLSNFETTDHKPLQIILVGQNELLRRLAAPELRQLNQRIGARAVLTPLSVPESYDYIAFRLKTKGGDCRKLFMPAALRLVVERSRGNPRRINVLCHNAMLQAYAGGAPRVSAATARSVITEYDSLLKSHWSSLSLLLDELPLGIRRFFRSEAILLVLATLGIMALGFAYLWSAGAVEQQEPVAGEQPLFLAAPKNSDADKPAAALPAPGPQPNRAPEHSEEATFATSIVPFSPTAAPEPVATNPPLARKHTIRARNPARSRIHLKSRVRVQDSQDDQDESPEGGDDDDTGGLAG